jgi:hypothetical protein
MLKEYIKCMSLPIFLARSYLLLPSFMLTEDHNPGERDGNKRKPNSILTFAASGIHNRDVRNAHRRSHPWELRAL